MMQTRTASLPPISLARSIWFFLIPALFMQLMMWAVLAFMDFAGVDMFVTLAVGLVIPALLFLAAAFFFAWRESKKTGKDAYSERLRLGAFQRSDWLWTGALIVVCVLSTRLLGDTPIRMEAFLDPPKFLLRMLDATPGFFLERSLSENVWLLPAVVIILSVDAIGQEIWWRGYVLPRQEAAFGRIAWLLHGLLYCFFLLFLFWHVVQYLIPIFAISFVSQKLRNTWPAILAHFAATAQWFTAFF